MCMVEKIKPTYLGAERLKDPQKGDLFAFQDRRGYIHGVSHQFVREDPFLVGRFQGLFPGTENDLILAEDVIRLDPAFAYDGLSICQDGVYRIVDRPELINWSVRHVFQGEEQIAKAIQAEREFKKNLYASLKKGFGSVEEKIRFLEEQEVRIDH